MVRVIIVNYYNRNNNKFQNDNKSWQHRIVLTKLLIKKTSNDNNNDHDDDDYNYNI